MTEGPNFSHLRGLNVDSSVAVEYVFYTIVGEPTLMVKPSTEGNRGYLNAMLRQGRRLSRRMRGGKMTGEVLAESRDQDRGLFALHVVTGWKQETVLDRHGKEVPFDHEACLAFLTALPNHMFDELRTFCGDVENFRPETTGDEEDAEAVAGN